MELRLLKAGNLMGSPDAKAMQLRAGPGSQEAHALWLDIARIKTAFGYDGGCTSLLLDEPDLPAAFPALVDPSWITPAVGVEDALERALTTIRAAGHEPDAVRSVLVTHAHPDHFDPRLLDHLPRATAYAHPDAPIAGCRPFEPGLFGGRVEALSTPGHGGPHTSYLFELDAYRLAACAAGDLVMSHAHYLDRRHPLAFSEPERGLESIERVRRALAVRGRAYSLVFPGHGLPFFLDAG